MVLIDALFINKGGGAVLLQYLIEIILAHPKKNNFFFFGWYNPVSQAEITVEYGESPYCPGPKTLK